MSAAGMLMLALREPALADHWLAHCALKAFTWFAIESWDRMRQELAIIQA